MFELQLAQDEYVSRIMQTQPSEFREQKKLILQSSIDKNMYNRIGDDP